MALTDKLTAIGNAIRAKAGGTEPLTLDEMPGAIEGIETGVTLAALAAAAGAENIELGRQAYDSSGSVIEGALDTSLIRQESYDEGAASVDTSLYWQEGYDAGYAEGAAGGSGAAQPLTYSWDEDTLTLTISEV